MLDPISLGINCKQGCSDVHVVMNGSLYWNKETLVDEQKEFLQLEFHNSNPKQLMNLKLELIETIYKNESLFELYPTQITISQHSKSTSFLNVTKTQYNNFNQKWNQLILSIKHQLFHSKNNVIIHTLILLKIQLMKIDHLNGIIIIFNYYKIFLLFLNSYLPIIVNILYSISRNHLYLRFQLNIDNNNTISAKELIKKCQLDPPLTNVSNSKNWSFTLKLHATTFLMKKVNSLLNIVLFNLQIILLKFKDPFIIYFCKQCDKKDKDLENNQEFPIYIETKQNTNELFRAGVSQLDYNYTTKSIREDTNAFQMFIYFKTKDKQIIQDRLFPNGKSIDIEILTRVQDQEILKFKHQIKIQMNNIDDRKQILLYIECQQQGNSTVYVDIIFNYLDDSHKQASFSFNKFCAKIISKQEKTLFGEIVYYIICIIAMLFGVQTIRVYTNLIKQDTNGSEIKIDSTYKRGYDNIEEEKQIEL